MAYLLRDNASGDYFCRPFGADRQEWSPDPQQAHKFATIERAQGGQAVWLMVHEKQLDVIPYTTAVTNAKAV